MSRYALCALFAGASLATLAATLLPQTAFAAETPMPADAPAADDQSTAVKELVVKADRKQTPASAEAVTAAEISETVNAVNAEDVVKYLPSLLVRKRHIGDTQAPLATRTNGGGSSARTLIYADGVLLSALIGNNNSTASPRWGLVDPADISSVSFLYGPFSAAYAGNSIGGVLNIRTRAPDGLDATVRAVGSRQSFKQYATADSYGAGQISASIGDRIGKVWFRASGNLVDSHGQPLSYVTVARPATAVGGADTVTGVFTDVNRTNAPIGVFGAGGLEHQIESNLNLKVGYDLAFASLVYGVGGFANNTEAHAESYVRDLAGATVYAGTVRVGGYNYTLGATAFAPYTLDEAHLAQNLSLTSHDGSDWTWSLTASKYDYQKDDQRAPTTSLPGSLAGGAGTITRMGGTNWKTFDATTARTFGGQSLSFGAHADEVELRSAKYNTAEWRTGAPGALTQQSAGRTTTEALWVQDVIAVDDSLKLTLGARYESWAASRGYNYSASPTLAVNQPRLSDKTLSPKAALTFAPAGGWSVTASYGEAYRFPTVTELYQAISTTTGGVATLSVPNPTLRPEHARSAEVAVERQFESGRVRASLFSEDIDDALLTQAAPLVPGSATLYSYVQNIDHTRVQGLELVAERRDILVKGLDLQASVTLTDPKVTRDSAFAAAVGKQLPNVPKLKATAVATWRPSDRWSLSLAGRYSDRVYTAIDNSDVVTHTYQGFDGFFVADARVSYKVDQHWVAALGVDNIGDRRYFLFHPFPGRTVQAELNYRF